jgi:F-type H+-transporting ATPase subunit c
MAKYLKPFMILSLFMFLMSMPLLAQTERTFNPQTGSIFKLAIIVAGAVITLAAAAGAFCQAKAISSACEGISRNPASAPHIRFLVLLGLVLIETLVIYALFIAIFIVMIQWGNYFLT